MFRPYLFLIVESQNMVIMSKQFKNNGNLSETSGASPLSLLSVRSVCAVQNMRAAAFCPLIGSSSECACCVKPAPAASSSAMLNSKRDPPLPGDS